MKQRWAVVSAVAAAVAAVLVLVVVLVLFLLPAAAAEWCPQPMPYDLDYLETEVAPRILPADRTGKTYIRLLAMAIVEGNRTEMERISRDGLQPHLLKFYC